MRHSVIIDIKRDREAAEQIIRRLLDELEKINEKGDHDGGQQ